jgi:hypothetical protein
MLRTRESTSPFSRREYLPLPEKREPLAVGQPEVQESHVGLALVQRLARVRQGGDRGHLEPLAPEPLGQDAQEQRIVLDDQEPFAGHR